MSKVFVLEDGETRLANLDDLHEMRQQLGAEPGEFVGLLIHRMGEDSNGEARE